MESDTELIDRVQQKTDMAKVVIPDEDMQLLVDDAKDELATLARVPVAEIPFYEDTHEGRVADRALLWTTCLYCLMKAGIVDGADISLAEFDIQSRRAAGEKFGGLPTEWYSKALEHTENLIAIIEPDDGWPYGLAAPERPNRQYTDLDGQPENLYGQ